MGQGTLIRKHARKEIILEAITKAARAAGDLPETEAVTMTIRKVTALELTKHLGSPPAMLRAASAREPGETTEAFHARWQQMVKDDPELAAGSAAYTSDLQRAVIAFGAIEPRIRLEPRPDHDDDLIPEDLGDDMMAVYEAIVTHSGLPFQLREGAGQAAAFPAGQTSGGPEQDGPLLRHDTEPAPELEPR